MDWEKVQGLMSSTSPEVPVESGSYGDLKTWDVNAMAEPIMRIWQLSEALSRMARRIQRRYPREAKVLRTASEDVIYSFYRDMKEKQEEFVKNSRHSEMASARDLDTAHLRRAQDREQEGLAKPKSRRGFTNV
jgi:hypothetical protein